MENLAELIKSGQLVIEPIGKKGGKKTKKSVKKDKKKKKKEKKDKDGCDESSCEEEEEKDNSKEELKYLKKFLEYVETAKKREAEVKGFHMTQDEKGSIVDDVSKIKAGSFEKSIYGTQDMSEYFQVKEYVDKIIGMLYNTNSFVM